MNPLAGIAAIFGAVALGASRKVLTPGQQITQIAAKYDNIIAELDSPMRRGNCDEFNRIYISYSADIKKADGLFSQQKRIDKFRRSEINDHMRIVRDFKPAFDDCVRRVGLPN